MPKESGKGYNTISSLQIFKPAYLIDIMVWEELKQVFRHTVNTAPLKVRTCFCFTVFSPNLTLSKLAPAHWAAGVWVKQGMYQWRHGGAVVGLLP